jgi:hypothetical protein
MRVHLLVLGAKAQRRARTSTFRLSVAGLVAHTTKSRDGLGYTHQGRPVGGAADQFRNRTRRLDLQGIGYRGAHKGRQADRPAATVTAREFLKQRSGTSRWSKPVAAREPSDHSESLPLTPLGSVHIYTRGQPRWIRAQSLADLGGAGAWLVPPAARARAPRGEAEVLRLQMPQTVFSSPTSVTVSLRESPSNRPSSSSS